MNVYGMRLQLADDPDLGHPKPLHEQPVQGVVRLYKRVDNSRLGREDSYRVEVTIPWFEIPQRTAEEPLSMVLAGAPLTFTPQRDVWTAPEHVASLILTVGEEPETRYSVKPRPANWRPE